MQRTVLSTYPNLSAEQSDQHNSYVILYTRVMPCLTRVPTASGYLSCRKILWYEVSEDSTYWFSSSISAAKSSQPASQ